MTGIQEMHASSEPLFSSSSITLCDVHEDAPFSTVHFTAVDKDAQRCGEEFPPADFALRTHNILPLSLRTNNLLHHPTQNITRSPTSHLRRKFRSLRPSRETAQIPQDPPSAFYTRVYRPIDDDRTKLPWNMADTVGSSRPGSKPASSFGTMCRACFVRSPQMGGSAATSTQRRIDKFPMLNSGPQQYQWTPTRSTEALASLVWTGDLSVSLPAGVNGLPRFKSSRNRLRPSRSLFIKSYDEDDTHSASALNSQSFPYASQSSQYRHGSEDPGPPNYRHSIAMAIKDDKLSDEMLLSELETMMEQDDLWHSESEHRMSNDFLCPECSKTLHSRNTDQPICEDAHCGLPNNSTTPPWRYKPLPPLPMSEVLSPSSTWTMARRALLICRELVLTERDYLSTLRILSSGETHTPPPPLMLAYLPPLVQASEAFVARIEQNPSAQGVADAFWLGQAEMEAAFVGWCGIVGSFFVGNEESQSRSRSVDVGDAENMTSSVRLKRRVSSMGRRMSLYLGSNGSPVAASPEQDVLPEGRRKRRPGIRDLAIRPCQRVMRYVLLFRDLLAHTPASLPCRSAVERALQSATAIAQKSNKAQENASFLKPSFKS